MLFNNLKLINFKFCNKVFNSKCRHKKKLDRTVSNSKCLIARYGSSTMSLFLICKPLIIAFKKHFLSSIGNQKNRTS